MGIGQVPRSRYNADVDSEGFVYILQSEKNKRFYVGSSTKPLERFQEHNAGRVTATRNLTPWRICFVQEFSTINQARKVEIKLKKLKSRKILEQIIGERKIRLSTGL